MLRWVIVTLILAAAFLESGMRTSTVTGAEAFQVLPTAIAVPQSSSAGINPSMLPGGQAQTSAGTGPVVVMPTATPIPQSSGTSVNLPVVPGGPAQTSTGTGPVVLMPTAMPVPQSSGAGNNLPVLPGGQAQTSTGTGPVRLPGQDCRGLGNCAWRGQSEFTGTCTADARVCMSTGSDPAAAPRVCSGQGGMRSCADAGGVITNGNPSAANSYPGGTTNIYPGGLTTYPGVNR